MPITTNYGGFLVAQMMPCVRGAPARIPHLSSTRGVLRIAPLRASASESSESETATTEETTTPVPSFIPNQRAVRVGVVVVARCFSQDHTHPHTHSKTQSRGFTEADSAGQTNIFAVEVCTCCDGGVHTYTM